MSIIDQYRVRPGQRVDLSQWKTSDSEGIEREDAEMRTQENAGLIADLQHKLYAQNTRSLLVVLQAMDAGGKDSSIRHVFSRTNPQGVRAKSFTKPTPDELAHDFLWRVHLHAPRRGHIAIFNRSHYEDLVIGRVDKLVPEERWRARFDAINGFEETLSIAGTRVIKIYLHLSKDRQRAKLRKRLTDPEKNWKFEESDLRTREKWDRYMEAYAEAISRCNSTDCPWYIVPTDQKWYRLLVVSQIVREELESMEPRFPEKRISTERAMELLDRLD